MAKDTPSTAKNKIKRSLGAICDPHPLKREEDELCEYCGVSIGKASRTGHLYHLIPTSEGGSNSIHKSCIISSCLPILGLNDRKLKI